MDYAILYYSVIQYLLQILYEIQMFPHDINKLKSSGHHVIDKNAK